MPKVSWYMRKTVTCLPDKKAKDIMMNNCVDHDKNCGFYLICEWESLKQFKHGNNDIQILSWLS